MTVWYTSDLHLGHERICELAGRPFSSVQEMDDELVRRWNAVVQDEDFVLVLGDLAMGKLEHSLARAAELRGHKFLVPGNHDRVSSVYHASETRKAEWRAAYEAAGFTMLSERSSSLYLRGQLVLLCHFPYEGDSHDADRYAEARPRDEGLWLLHGHTHSRERVRGRQVHVGCDAWDYAPVSEDEVAALLK